MAAKRIFVSHSHTDNEWCRVFVGALGAVGYDVWYDETGLQGADEWVRSLEREIEARDILLLVLTPDAMGSSWVRRELDLAMATHRVILPIMVRLTERTGFLRTIQHINAVDQDELGAARLTIAALEVSPSRPFQAPQVQYTAKQQPADLVILATQHWYAKQWAEAIEECNRALAVDPNCTPALKLKAEMLESSAQSWDAALTLLDVLALSPFDASVRRHLDRLAIAMGPAATNRLRNLITERRIPPMDLSDADDDLSFDDGLPF